MKKLKVKLVHSPAGCSERQKMTVKGLGFTKVHQTKELIDTPALRGMINKVSHLVQIVDQK